MSAATGNKLVLVGDSGVGKTCLISRFISGHFDTEAKSTNGASYASKKVEYPELGKSLVLDIWDTAGQEKYKSLTKFFYKDAVMIILVYDITRKESFDNLKNFWYKEIKDNGEQNIVLGIAGNKSDLYDNEENNFNQADNDQEQEQEEIYYDDNEGEEEFNGEEEYNEMNNENEDEGNYEEEINNDYNDNNNEQNS